ncbi:GTPase Der [Candidatus Gugararchaeum adminiculabundum]|nr:GTPase Der [Candidatus Gugararchaeum adminiculabundum]
MPLLRKKINFPKIAKFLSDSDIAIEVLDARDIQGTRVLNFDRRMREKMFLAINKSDLISEKFKSILILPDKQRCFFISSKTKQGIPAFKNAVLASAREKLARKPAGGEIRIVVFGFPNVGKSSFINAFTGKQAAKTGFLPGITRSSNWIKIANQNIFLCDTPGVVNFEEKKGAIALKGAISAENVPDPESLALTLIQNFINSNNDEIFHFYRVPISTDANKVLESIARRRGFLQKGGEASTFEAAKVILREFQKGKFIL